MGICEGMHRRLGFRCSSEMIGAPRLYDVRLMALIVRSLMLEDKLFARFRYVVDER